METSSRKREQERRVNQRFELRTPVEFRGDDDTIAHGDITDVSLAGMMIRCDRTALRSIAPKFDKTTPDEAPRVRACFALPADSVGEIEVDCKVVHIRRFSQSEYFVHLNYENFAGASYDELRHYIETLVELGARPS
ncbi:MAG: PilZ domain-containing protein [Gammaproteobacteria bacterium]|nr:PilZ domain-containing protein [Gammaproteobacteria bacterium]